MLNKFFKYRFEIFFLTIILILFSPRFLLNNSLSNLVSQIAFVLNFLAGILLLSSNKKLMGLFFSLVGIIVVVIVQEYISKKTVNFFEYIKLACFFIFYVIVSLELIKQVIKSKLINRDVIIGLMCGYICIGLVCFFGFFTIELMHPGSFNGIYFNKPLIEKMDSLLYFSYVTLLTIGYGDITPLTEVAKRATILTGFLGQFYMVILTSIIVGKYVNQISKKDKSI